MPTQCKTCGNSLDTSGSCHVCLLQLGVSDLGRSPMAEEAASPASSGRAPLPSLQELNAQFPQLEVTRLIGRGGMGAIYHARQKSLDRDVALKLIAKDVVADTAFVERFEREAKTLAKLSHPNIVTIFDYGHTSDGTAYLIMEYVDGINLREAMATGSVGSGESLEIIVTICGALEYAHSKNVIHRDIKPENILLGEDGTLKVADFGIAKILDDTVHTPTLTATRQVLGSMHYLAPEHLESPEQVDHRVDLYAVGVIFYELLTGQMPLGRYEPPSQVTPGIDRRVDAIVMKTLCRRPAQRYQQASQLDADVRALQRSSEVVELPEISPIDSARVVSVPFSCDAMGGFAEAVGMLLATDDYLTIEYRVRDAIFGSVKTSTRRIKIPAERLTRLQLKRGLFNRKLLVRADSISALEEFPNAEEGQVSLKVKRIDAPFAERMVSMLGFGGSLKASQAGDEYADVADVSAKHRLTFAFLMILCGIVNAGLLGIAESIFATALQGNELVAAAVGTAVFIGPVALVQFGVGVVSLLVMVRSLAWAASVLSMIPIAPAWPLSFATGLWAVKWLFPASPVAVATLNPKQSPGPSGWGATTLQFIRESRWSRGVAALNVIGLLVFVAGLFVYQRGYYPSRLRFRIVAADSVDHLQLLSAVKSRLASLNLSFYSASENRLEVESLACNATEIAQLLSVEGTIQLNWLAPADFAQQPQLLSGGPRVSGLPVAPGIQLSEFATTTSYLGPTVIVQGEPIALTPQLVSKVTEQRTEQGRQLIIELTAEGRAAIAEALPKDQTAAGLGVVIEGVLEGIAPQETLSGKQITLTLASGSDLEAVAIIAAIRGPALPSELERLE